MQKINGKCNSVKQSLIVYESFTTNSDITYCINKFFCNNQYLFDCQTVFLSCVNPSKKGQIFLLKPIICDLTVLSKKWDLFRKVNSNISFTQSIQMNRKIQGKGCNLRVLHTNRLVKYVFMACCHAKMNHFMKYWKK